MSTAAKMKELPNKTKAAVLMMVLGPEIAGDIVKHLSEAEIELLALEVARMSAM
jgi:flagellar motor switch protein FliG